MAKKKDEKSTDKPQYNWFTKWITDKGSDFIVSIFQDFINKLSKSITDQIYKINKKFIQTIIYFLAFISGIILLIAGIIILLNEYFNINKGWIYTGIAIILLIWAWSIKKQVEQIN